jgi:chemotaxis protein methyltransferase CheR
MADNTLTAIGPGIIGASPELSERDFFSFCQLVHQHAGIHLTAEKKELVRARLTKILRQRRLQTFRDYYDKVVADDSGVELTCLLDAISTNQTAFWREPKHFEYLSEEILPVWPRERRRPLRGKLWSAGCSSGEEPYTLAILIMAGFPEEDLSQAKIYASDLNTQVLAQAERGIYPISRVDPLPPEWRRRFFQKGVGDRQGFVRVKPEVRHLVNFFRFNLMDQPPFREELDIIFCRNVMIYFEKETQVKLVNKFYDCLRPGGYLFIGHSESLCNHRHQFSYVKPTIYRK